MADQDPDTVMFYCPPISGLKRVPLEILIRITSFVSTTDLCNVRLTCRTLERSLYTTFVNEFFTRKQFMMSEDSLECLIAIARSRVGPHLRYVHIGLEHYPNQPPASGGDVEQDAAATERHASMFTLWNTGNQRDMLADAFRHLPNLEDIVIRSFNSEKRSRDGYRHQWTSYGATTAGRELGYSIVQGANMVGEISDAFSSKVFAAVIAALGQAGARPRGIEVLTRGRQHQIKNFAFRIAPYMEHDVCPVLKHLEKLHLDLDLDLGGRMRNETPPCWNKGDTFHMRRFLSLTPNLKHLRLNALHHGRQDDKPLMQWLASPCYEPWADPEENPEDSDQSRYREVLPGPRFRRLEELNLGRMNLDEQSILDVVAKFAPTLKRLELVHLTIQASLPRGHDLDEADPAENLCARFLARLRDEVPRLDLRHIALRNVQQQFSDSNRGKRRVSFAGEAHMAYTGPDWKHFVTETIAKTEVEKEPEGAGRGRGFFTVVTEQDHLDNHDDDDDDDYDGSEDEDEDE